jgi:hypothetical protein
MIKKADCSQDRLMDLELVCSRNDPNYFTLSGALAA